MATPREEWERLVDQRVRAIGDAFGSTPPVEATEHVPSTSTSTACANPRQKRAAAGPYPCSLTEWICTAPRCVVCLTDRSMSSRPPP